MKLQDTLKPLGRVFFVLSLALALPAGAAGVAPEFHPLQPAEAKSAGESGKPLPVRAERPLLMQTVAHRHADGSLHLQCEHLHGPSVRAQASATRGAQP
jgi:hypothetical protein